MRCREIITDRLAADVVLLQETWRIQNESIQLNNYTVYCNNRRCINRNSPKGSGGVAIAVHNILFNEYYVDILEDRFDGILIVKLAHKHTDYTCAIVCAYLPPDNSVYGEDPF